MTLSQAIEYISDCAAAARSYRGTTSLRTAACHDFDALDFPGAWARETDAGERAEAFALACGAGNVKAAAAALAAGHAPADADLLAAVRNLQPDVAALLLDHGCPAATLRECARTGRYGLRAGIHHALEEPTATDLRRLGAAWGLDDTEAVANRFGERQFRTLQVIKDRVGLNPDGCVGVRDEDTLLMHAVDAGAPGHVLFVAAGLGARRAAISKTGESLMVRRADIAPRSRQRRQLENLVFLDRIAADDRNARFT